MKSIPEPLAARFELLQELTTAYDLLDGLPSDGAEAEREFLQKKIADIEKELDAGEAVALALLELIHDDSRAWLAASLRYRQGYSWAEVADMIGGNEPAIKARVYRKMKQAFMAGK